MIWISCPAILLLGVMPSIDTFEPPGYAGPVAGVWYEPGAASSAMPLGTLGTGFVELDSAGTFGDSTVENNWLNPQPCGARTGFRIQAGGHELSLLPDEKGHPRTMRFWGHFPAADIDFGDTFGDVAVYLRAFAPLAPHDYDLSNMPAALFRFVLENNSAQIKQTGITFEWEGVSQAGDKANGNAEGALAWRRARLNPGESWTVVPMIAFAVDKSSLLGSIERVDSDGKPLQSRDAPEGAVYDFGDVGNFFLDSFAGFDWEDRRRQSAVYSGAPNIGQLFWRLEWGGKSAGRFEKGPFGLAGDGLPAKTVDGVLDIDCRPLQVCHDGIALTFTIKNISETVVRDLRFGFLANMDLGGPPHAERQHAQLMNDHRAIVFECPRVKAVAALFGDADEYIVDTWPHAHQALASGKLFAFDDEAEPRKTTLFKDGAQLDVPGGSYAVGAHGGDKWVVEMEGQNGVPLAVDAKRVLEPGETAEVVFALAWHFPQWISSDGEHLRHRYADTYRDAGDTLRAALLNAERAERAIIDWQQHVYGSEIPGLLKDAVINGLYILARNTWWLDDGRFLQSESFTGCPITETFVCRFNGSFPLALLWPECEKATMRAVAAAQAGSGEIPFGFGRPLGSRSPMFHLQHPIVSSEFVLTTWRNYELWHDKDYLEEMYPCVRKALRFAMTLDKDGDGLIDEDPGSETGFPANQYYDIWPWWGTSAYTGSIWLAALKVGARAAEVLEDREFAAELKPIFAKAARSFEEKLWTGRYYRLYNDPGDRGASDTILTNGLCGQWFAYTCGLSEIVPGDHIQSVIDTVLQVNAKATEYGAVNGVKPDGTIDELFPDHSAVITIGEVWNFCAMAAFAGRREAAAELFNESYANILLRLKTPWNITWSIDRRTGKLKWGRHYYSNTCVWTLYQALAPQRYHALGLRR